uniref:Programmed cell death 7 n=1 Tax=Paramormyrops kingsleyae TaxID=1676925 RepID=A0A3B3T8Y8_9TELE
MEKHTYSEGQAQRVSHPMYPDPNMLGMASGSFPGARSYVSASNEMLGSVPVPGGFWPSQGIYQHPPPPHQMTANNQRYVQPQWSPFISHMEHNRSDYRFGPPYHQGFNREPQDFSVQGFDPTRPPPALPFNPESNHRYSEADGPADPPSSADPDYGQHNQMGVSHLDRAVGDHSHSVSESRFNHPGFGGQQQGFDYSPGTVRYGRDSADHDTPPGCWQDGGLLVRLQPSPADPESTQRRLDEQWLLTFLLNRKIKKSSASKEPDSALPICELKERLYDAARLVSDLSLLCQTLKQNMEDEGVWTESYAKAAAMRSDLQDKLKVFGDSACMDACKKKVDLIRRKRARNRRKKRESCEEIKEKEARASEKDAAIEKWRMKRIQQVEEKKRELELRQAADSVLSEVRKKQADAKRMTDVLRSLEKLRRLRKEAAAKKGVHPEKEADEVFEGHLERLRRLIRKRTAVYAAEEKALRVMLEGEREEERKREQERKHRKEREKQLQRRREVECVLFGDEMPSDHPLQPYRQYYLQAETSLHALIQTRRAWDQYLVPSDVPEGSFIPQSWVLPELPSDEVWSTALDKQNTGGD